MKKLKTITRRGKFKGDEQYPSSGKDGYYIVSHTRFECDYIKVKTLGEVYEHYKKRIPRQNESWEIASWINCPKSIIEY